MSRKSGKGATRPAVVPGITLVAAVVGAFGLSGCGSGSGATPGPGDANAPAAGSGAGSGAVLDGAALLERTCTQCHGLEGIYARAPYWGEREWADMVETMIGYGAVLSDEEKPVLVRYLGEEF